MGATQKTIGFHCYMQGTCLPQTRKAEPGRALWQGQQHQPGKSFPLSSKTTLCTRLGFLWTPGSSPGTFSLWLYVLLADSSGPLCRALSVRFRSTGHRQRWTALPAPPATWGRCTPYSSWAPQQADRAFAVRHCVRRSRVQEAYIGFFLSWQAVS